MSKEMINLCNNNFNSYNKNIYDWPILALNNIHHQFPWDIASFEEKNSCRSETFSQRWNQIVERVNSWQNNYSQLWAWRSRCLFSSSHCWRSLYTSYWIMHLKRGNRNFGLWNCGNNDCIRMCIERLQSEDFCREDSQIEQIKGYKNVHKRSRAWVLASLPLWV